MKNFAKTFLAASTCLFLAIPSYAFELSGKVTVSIRNVSVGNGVFQPVARLTDATGSYQDIKVGEQGLTSAILYNREALSAWVTTQLPVETSADGTTVAPVEIVEEVAPEVEVEVEEPSVLECGQGFANIDGICEPLPQPPFLGPPDVMMPPPPCDSINPDYFCGSQS